MSVAEHYEQLLAFISTHLPEPFTQEDVDGAVIFTAGAPSEVIVRLTDTAVFVDEYAIRWETPYTQVVRPRRVGMLKWRRLPESQLMSIVGALIKGASATRRGRYRTCRVCGQTNAPEWMADGSTCQQCAEREVGVVH